MGTNQCGRRLVSAPMLKMRGRQVSLGVVIWIVIGLVIAANKGFLDDLGSLERILSAVLAVTVWPLVLLDIHFGV